MRELAGLSEGDNEISVRVRDSRSLEGRTKHVVTVDFVLPAEPIINSPKLGEIFGEKDDISVSGSYVRVVAASLLWHKNSSAVIVLSGGRGQANTVFPPGLFLSTIMKKELEDIGIPESIIMEENQSGNTYQQLTAILSMATRHHWSEVQIVSNRFHLPRIQAMVECLEPLIPLRSIVFYVSAEEVVLAAEPKKWREQIDAAYASVEFAEIISNEARGTAQVRSGEYLIH